MDAFTINVLLSTYNGEKFLREQLDSVIKQENVTVRLYIRDDGSTDNTINILKEYQQQYSNIYLYLEQNIGCINSFFRLIKIAYDDNNRGRYYAFCDQDDIWDTDKLWYGINKIISYESNSTPTLYCSNLKIVDSDLNFKRLMYKQDEQPSKGRSLVHNICTGCTIIANQKLIDLYRSFNNPRYIVMHDWYLYILASFMGRVIYDKIPHIQYRQHMGNVVGANKNSLISKVKHFIVSTLHKEKEHYREKQAMSLYSVLNDYLCDNDKDLIGLVAFYRKNVFSRFNLVFNNIICKKDISLRIRIIFGLI